MKVLKAFLRDLSRLLKVRKISLRYKLLLVFLCLGLLPVLIVGGVSFFQSNKSIFQNTVIYSSSVINQVAGNFDRWLSEYNYTTMEMINSENFQNGVQNDEDDFLIDQYYKLKLTFYVVNRPEIKDISVYRSNDQLDSLKSTLLVQSLRTTMLKGSEAVGRELYDRVMKASGETVWLNGKVYRSNEKTFDNNITMVRKILGFKSGKELGIFIMHLDAKRIEDIYNDVNLAENGFILIVDSSGKVVSSSGNERNGSSVDALLLNGVSQQPSGSFICKTAEGEMLVNYATSEVTGWKVVSLVPTGSLMKNIYIATGITILIAFIILICILVLSFVASNLIFRPIKLLKTQMKRVEMGDLDITVQPISRDEIGELTQGFRNMVNEVRKLMQAQKEEHSKLKAAELLALQSQINPHFLYNTIDVALWYAKEIQSQEIQNILLSLANFYRISLSSGNNLISISNELAHVRSYIEIESVRFEGKFEVEYDIDEEILPYSIVKITLQPLVENAIKHGIRKRPGKGKIIISGRREGRKIILRIADDGVGMTETQIHDIMNKQVGGGEAARGYGIGNVNDRLVLQYGEEYGLKYTSEKGYGTTVEIVVPALKSGPADDRNQGGAYA